MVTGLVRSDVLRDKIKVGDRLMRVNGVEIESLTMTQFSRYYFLLNIVYRTDDYCSLLKTLSVPFSIFVKVPDQRNVCIYIACYLLSLI